MGIWGNRRQLDHFTFRLESGIRGYVDIGSGKTPTDSTAVANEVLVLMVVALNAHLKVPEWIFFNY